MSPDTSPRPRPRHPAALILFLLFWTLSACLIDQPLPLLLMAGTFAAILLRCRPRALFMLLRLVIVFLPVLLLINLLFSGSGYTPLMELPWGRTVMLEPMLFSGVMLIKIMLVMALFMVALSLGQRSEIIRWMMRHLPQTGLLCSIALAGMPAIRDQFQRSAFAIGCRIPDHLPRHRRLGIQLQLWIPLLHYVLGCSLQTADVLNARAWNTGPRSCYRRPDWKGSDRLLTSAALMVFLLTLAGIWQDILRFPWQADGTTPLSPDILSLSVALLLPLVCTAVLSLRHDRSE